jgi:hypothetical protein
VKRLLGLVSVLATLAALGALAATASGQIAPRSLDGEYLVESGFVTEDASEFGAVQPPASSCDLAGSSTIYFSAAGDAVGPFPGTFTETGSLTFGPQNGPLPVDYPWAADGLGESGTVATFTGRFEIDSGITTITGAETLTGVVQGQPFTSAAACGPFEDSSWLGEFDPSAYLRISGRNYFADFGSQYTAVVNTGSEQFTTTGDGQTFFNESYLTGATCVPNVPCDVGSASNAFQHNFHSAPFGPPPPTSTAGCSVSLGGWTNTWVYDTNGTTKDTLGGQASAQSATTPQGEQEYQARSDPSGPTDLTFKSTSTTALVCDGNEAQIYGVGTVNGQSVNYWIDTTDQGKQGDTFRISWIGANVPLYDSEVGILGGGNVTIRP